MKSNTIAVGLGWPWGARITIFPRPIVCLFLVSASLVFAASAESSSPPISGMVELIAPPPSVAPNALESNSFVRFFNEQTGVLLNQSIDVDITQPSVVDEVVDLTPGQIAANQRVDSYFFHADTIPGIPGGGVTTFQGSVVFDAPVLGILVRGASLDATDAILGSPSTTYLPSSIYRGFDGPDFSTSADAVRDLVQLSPDLRTITFQLHTASYTDQIRVITASVPEPTTLALAGGCLLCGIAVRRRRVR